MSKFFKSFASALRPYVIVGAGAFAVLGAMIAFSELPEPLYTLDRAPSSIWAIGLFNGCLAAVTAALIVCCLKRNLKEDFLQVLTCLMVASFAMSVLPAAGTVYTAQYYAAYHRRMAPAAQSFLLAHFDELDTTGDTIVSLEELAAGLSNPKYSDSDRELIRYLGTQRATLGIPQRHSSATSFKWKDEEIPNRKLGVPKQNDTWEWGYYRFDANQIRDQMLQHYRQW